MGILTRRDLLKVFLRSDEEIREEVMREVLMRRFGPTRRALPGKHLARQGALVRTAEDLELVVEPLQHRRDPTTGAFEERHAQRRMAFADAAEDEQSDRHLEVERVGQALLEGETRDRVRRPGGETQNRHADCMSGTGDGWIPIGHPISEAACQNGS